MASFASAKVVIDTLCMNPIDDEAVLQVGDKGYRISVFEAKTEFTIFHMGSVDEASSPSMKINCSQREKDEDSRGEVPVQADLAQDDWCKVLSQAEAQKDSADEGEQSPADQGSSKTHSNSNLAHEGRQPRLSPDDSSNSVYRTKTATFSQQGDTEEAINSLLKVPLEDGAINSSLKIIETGKDVVISAEHVNALSSPLKEDYLSTPDVEKGRSQYVEPPPGFENKGGRLSTPNVDLGRTEGDEPPPGFDMMEAQEVVKNTRKKQMCTERRLTRSQVKFDRSSSQGTTESIRKIAEEALEIGKILGVKVITYKGNANRRSIDSQKEDKRKRSNVEQGKK